ncbi:hypothetical protein GALL_509950 [mine drainage metagenome]|uniref:Permuted papain-like amidase YaeF/Yiix C92 family enzyme n=1 Tax=mine drainage metagenome TaxID=410659 RepID=A0A1J5P9L1_9ZZZZ
MLFAGAAALTVAGSGGLTLLHPTPAARWQIDDVALRTGDLLFRRTVSLEGLGVRAIDAAGRFSHVGLIVGHDVQGRARVVHACPPEQAGQTGVRETTAQDFVAGGDVRDAAAAGLPLSAAQGQRLAAWALQHVGWRFNADFQLSAPHALYCTELIWAAMRAAQLQRLPKLAHWSTPFGAREVVPMSALLALPDLRFLPQAVQRLTA